MEQFINHKKIGNKWSIIKIQDLPEDFPIITVREYPTKSLAEFHLEEYCIVPENLMEKIKQQES